MWGGAWVDGNLELVGVRASGVETLKPLSRTSFNQIEWFFTLLGLLV